MSNLFSDKIKLGTASMQVVKVCDVLLALAKLEKLVSLLLELDMFTGSPLQGQ